MLNLSVDIFASLRQYLNVPDLIALQGSCRTLRDRLMNTEKIWKHIAPGTTREAAIATYKAEHLSLPLKGGKFTLGRLPDATPFSTEVDMSLPLRQEISEKCSFKHKLFGEISALVERHGYVYVATKKGHVSVFKLSSGERAAPLINDPNLSIQGLRFAESGELVISYWDRLRKSQSVARVEFSPPKV